MTFGRLHAISNVSTRHNSSNESHVNSDTTCENSGHNMRTVGRASTVTGTGFTRASDVLGYAIILATSTGFTSAGEPGASTGSTGAGIHSGPMKTML